MLNINFQGQDWSNFVIWLKEEQLVTYKRLVSVTNDENETQRLRGRALFIEQLLDLDNGAAEQAA